MVCLPISVLKRPVDIGSHLNWVLQFSSAFCNFTSMWVILMCTFVCMSAILDVFVSDINVAFSLTWKGLGIMLMTLSGWFDLVRESYVYNVDGLSIYDIQLQHQ